MKKVDQFIKYLVENDKTIHFYEIVDLNLDHEGLNYLIKKLDENKIGISSDSIKSLISSKEKELSKSNLSTCDTLMQYFKEINKFEMLDACEEKALFYFYKESKSYDLRNSIISFYLRLVVSIAMEYVQKIKNTSYELLDVIQEGNNGLIIAVNKFDVTMGTRFSVYASWWIRRIIELELLENSKGIRMPSRLVEDYNKIISYIKRCENEGKRDLTDYNIATAIGIKENRVNYALKIVGRTVVSLDEHIGNSDKLTKLGFISSNEPTLEELAIEKFEQELINRIMRNVLDEKEFFVVSYKNGFINETNNVPGDKTLEEVGKVLGVTRERVRQILKKAYEKIKNTYENEIKNKKLIKK